MSTAASVLVNDASSTPASVFSRLQFIRKVGFQGFVLNKAFVISDAVPKGKVRAILAISAFRLAAAGRILHFFAIPPGIGDPIVNPTTDTTSPIFLAANNNPPISAGVLISVGGNSSVPEMQAASSASVNGSPDNALLPEGWKVLCFVDSGEGVTNPTADGITLDMAVIDFDYCECLPDGLL